MHHKPLNEGGLMKERIFDLIKWTVLILIAASFFHGAYAKEDVNCDCNRYAISATEKFSYKIDQCTGEVWLVTPDSMRPIIGNP